MNNAQIVTIPFRAGIDEKTDPKQAPPGTLTLLRNGVFTRQGEIGKRFGTLRLSEYDPALNLVTIKRIFARGSELCGIDAAGYVYSYSEKLARWIQHDLAPEWSAKWDVAVDALVGVCDPDMAVYDGVAVVVWRSGVFASGPSDVYVTAYEVATGTTLINTTKVASNGVKPHVIVESGIFVVGWVEGVGAPRDLKACTVTPATQTISAVSTIVGADVAGPQNLVSAVVGTYAEPSGWDMCGMGDGTVAYVYARNAGAPWLRVLRTYTNFVGISATSYNGYAAANRPLSVSIDLYPGTDLLYIAYATYVGIVTSDFRVGAFSFSTALTAWDTGPEVGANDFAPTSVRATATGCIAAWRRQSLRYTAAGVSSSNIALDGFPVTRPWESGSRVYLAATSSPKFYLYTANNDPLQNASLVVGELPLNASGLSNPALPAAQIAPRLSAKRSLSVANSCVVSASDVYLPLPYARELGEAAQLPVCLVAHLEKDDAARARTVTIGALAVVCGAAPWWFDGVTVGDVGFTGNTPTLTSSATAGSLIANTNYLVGIVYQRRDKTGLLHRSPVYLQTVQLAAAQTSLDISQRYISLTSKQKQQGSVTGTGLQTYIVVYVSGSNGAILTRAATPQPNNAGSTGAMALNVGSGGGGNGELVYTTGSRLDDMQPPGFRDLVVHRNRLWGISGDRRTVWYTKATSDDPSTFPGFNDLLTLRLDDSGDLVSLASHDSMLLLLTSEGAYYVEGDGPNAAGANNDLTPARRINCNVGCKDARSVVTYQDGTMFLGTDGRLYLVQRDLSVVPIGIQIEDTLAAYPVITSAVVVEDQDQVRISCVNTSTTNGVVMVFDYLTRQWSRFEYWDTSGAGASAPVVSATMWRGRYVFVFASGYVFMEDPTRYTDVDAWVTLQIETAWMSTTGPLGWQRVRRVQTLGEYRSAHGLTVEQAVDYSTTYQQTTTFTEANTLANKERLTVRIGAQNGMNPRCQAYRIRITDTAPAVVGTGQAARWSGIALEVLPATGLARHGAANAKG